MLDHYDHVMRFVRENPWALRQETLDSLVGVLHLRAGGIRFSQQEIDARVGVARAQALGRRGGRGSAGDGGAIVVIPLSGLIAHRAHMVNQVSTAAGTSTEIFGRQVREAAANPSVRGILLDVDSPGGSVFGVEEAANEIAAARGRKPVVASANSQAASAAYWIASQADELVVTPSGEVGSIGVLAIHEDWSKADEQLGVKVSYVHAGRFKVEGNPDEPLGDDARAYLQGRVNEYYDTFVRAVARGRGVTPAVVRESFGQGRMVGAQKAVNLRMADRVGTFDEALERLARRFASGPAARADGRALTAAERDLDERWRWHMRMELGPPTAEELDLAARRDWQRRQEMGLGVDL